jgi:DNA-binding protein H-NS
MHRRNRRNNIRPAIAELTAACAELRESAKLLQEQYCKLIEQTLQQQDQYCKLIKQTLQQQDQYCKLIEQTLQQSTCPEKQAGSLMPIPQRAPQKVEQATTRKSSKSFPKTKNYWQKRV